MPKTKFTGITGSLLPVWREDVAGEKTIGLTDGAVTQQTNTALTWRAGLLYHFDNGVAPYFNYATSFQPESGRRSRGTPFAPTTGQQYEAGIKYQPPGSNTIVTASLFNITQQNVLTADPTNGTSRCRRAKCVRVAPPLRLTCR